jgi:RNA polymerase sigma-70 factor (ECF subfamily)
LPERYRVILMMREVEGMSNREIATHLTISVAAVKSRLHRARLMLRKRLTGAPEKEWLQA